MKCPKCGAENPDYSFFCGRCASDLKGPAAGPDPRRESLPTIYALLSRRLVQIETNMQTKSRGALGRIRESLYRGGEIVFKSDLEVVTLVLGKDRHVSLIKGPPSKEDIVFEGPHEAFLSMFPEKEGFGYLPSNINVTVGSAAIPGMKSDVVIRDFIGRLLQGLFESDQAKLIR